MTIPMYVVITTISGGQARADPIVPPKIFRLVSDQEINVFLLTFFSTMIIL